MDSGGGSMGGGGVGLLLACVLAMTVLAAPAAAAPASSPAALANHAPILIDGNAGFTNASGVTGGTGTPGDPYRIQGWTIDASTAAGIHVRNTDAVFEILRVDVALGGPGNPAIWLENVTHASVDTANVTDSRYGVMLEGSSDVRVRASSAARNLYDGFFASASVNVTFENDNATDNGEYGFHFFSTVGGGVTNGTGSANGWNAAGASTEVFLEGATQAVVRGCVLLSTTQNGVYLAGSSDVLVAGNVLSNHSAGLFLDRSSRATVKDNTFSFNVEGVYANSEGLRVLRNTFTNNTYGVYLYGASNASIGDNHASSPFGYAVFLDSSSNASLFGNVFAHAGLNLAGNATVHFDSHTIAANNTVNGAPLRYFSRCGTVDLDGIPTGQLFVANCSRVTASNLTIGQTDVAVLLAFVGNATLRDNLLWSTVTGLALVNASGVWAYHNAFVNNQYHVASNARETWDAGYPEGGNYWSGATGVDACAGPSQDVCPDPDGILDTPRGLGAAGSDPYPLARPWNATPLPLAASFRITPDAGDTGTVFTFNASASTDPNGPDAGLLVRWDFDGDGVWDTAWTAQKDTTHAFGAPGAYNVKLEVSDFRGLTANETVQVVVRPAGILGLDLPIFLLVILVPVGAAALLLWWWRRRRVSSGEPPKSPGNP